MTTPPLAPGAVVGGFRLEAPLHRGGMATLWRVTRAGFDFPLLMKVPRGGYGEDHAAIVGFEVEQMIMPMLKGVHVPRFVAAGDFTAQPYIVMELVRGGSLRERISDAPLPAEAVAALGSRIATALHALHRQDVIHLDVKPSSVLFRPGGEAVLIDYGLAHHHRLPDLLAEEFRLPLGTAPYLSPEQVLGVRDDARSDLFALGVVLYHFATGARPFGNPSSIRGLRRRLYRDPVPPRALRPDLPPWLQEVILRCLEVDPALRYQTAAQVAFALQNPQQVTLTARAGRTVADSVLEIVPRWLRSLSATAPARPAIADQLSRAPIVMVAVDLSPDMEAIAEGLRRAAQRVLQTEPGARLACVTVLKTPRIAMDSGLDEQGRSLHVQRLVELQHWARPLRWAPDRVTFHVLQSPDPARALTEYAATNQVDHIVIGARGSSALRRYLGSVSSQVVAEAPCTVTVFRAAEAGEPEAPA
jgi:nucleotide-binding universal stress UspA family protein